jgi:hypothetical protein
MSRVIDSIVMPGGWHFPVLDRTGKPLPSPLRSNSYQQLIQAVIKFRADNVIPIGDVEAEVEEYICSNFPHMCHRVPGASVTVEVKYSLPKQIVTLTDRMLEWLDSRIENHSIENLELKSEAERRAEICSRCPYNVRWNSSCSTCVDAVNRMSTILRCGQDTRPGKKLRACQILGHENRAAVWLRRSNLASSPDLPSHCWLR